MNDVLKTHANMIEMDVSNYRGSLYIKEDHEKYYYAIECDFDNAKDWDWIEITPKLYAALLEFHKFNT